MKQKVFKVLMLVCASLVSSNLWAQDFTIDGIGYKISTENDFTCTVTGYDSSATETGTLSIPSSVVFDNMPYSVMGIADDLFNSSNSNITRIRFEDGEGTFNVGCHNNSAQSTKYGLFGMLHLEEFYLGRDLSYDKAPFVDWVFDDDTCTLDSLTIGEQVTEIGSYMFSSCTPLENITIPDNVKTIYSSAFYNCTGLVSVNLGNGVEYIGSSTFYSCKSLSSITIPNSVTSMYSSVFYNCTNLESVTLGEGLDTIGKETFRGCTSLKSIEIPENITSISESAFSGSGLTSIPVTTGVTIVENNTYTSSALLEAIVPEGITTINTYCFNNATAITKVELPTTLVTMGSYNFKYDTNISEVYSKNPTPPVTAGSNFESTVYKNATLYVPVGSLDLYKEATDWKSFSNIVEMTYSGVTDATTTEVKIAVNERQLEVKGADADTAVAIYSANGKLVYSGTDKLINLPERGIYIVKVGSDKPVKVAN